MEYGEQDEETDLDLGLWFSHNKVLINIQGCPPFSIPPCHSILPLVLLFLLSISGLRILEHNPNAFFVLSASSYMVGVAARLIESLAASAFAVPRRPFVIHPQNYRRRGRGDQSYAKGCRSRRY